MITKSLAIVVLTALAAGLTPASAQAQQRTAVLQLAQASGMSLQQAVQRVRSQYGGRIVSSHTQVSNGREVHVIRVLVDGKTVRTVRINGRRVRNK